MAALGEERDHRAAIVRCWVRPFPSIGAKCVAQSRISSVQNLRLSLRTAGAWRWLGLQIHLRIEFVVAL